MFEACSNTLLEAMACGLPIITTSCGGPEQYVKDNVNGFIVPVNDAYAFASKISEITNNNQLLNKFSENARNLMVNNYSLNKQKEVFINTLKELSNE